MKVEEEGHGSREDSMASSWRRGWYASWPPGLAELGVHRVSAHCSLREIQFKTRHDVGLQSQPLWSLRQEIEKIS